MERSLHISRDGQQFGPYKESTAREHLASGALKVTDNAWYSGADGWKPLKEVLDGAQSPAPTAPPPPQVSKIRVNRNGQEIGPYTREKAMEYFTAGQLLPTDMAWDDTSSVWKPLNEVLGLSQAQPPAVVHQHSSSPAKKLNTPVSRPIKKPKRPMSEKAKLLILGSVLIVVLAVLGATIPSIGAIVGLVLWGGGLALVVGSYVVFLIKAFGVSVLWGFGVLCIQPVQLVFLIMHWHETKNVFFAQLAGTAMWIIGSVLMAMS